VGFELGPWLDRWDSLFDVLLSIPIAAATIAAAFAARTSAAATKETAAATRAMTALAESNEKRRRPRFEVKVRTLDKNGWLTLEVINHGLSAAGLQRAYIGVEDAGGRVRTRELDFYVCDIADGAESNGAPVPVQETTIAPQESRRFLCTFDAAINPLQRGTRAFVVVKPVGGGPAISEPLEH
jgi:hypothetical protein